MPFNYFGDLYKDEIVSQLKNRGYNVRSVHALNVIMEEMGLQIHIGSDWITTKTGVGYTIWRGPVLNAQGWHSNVVDAIAKYLDENI